MGKMKLSESEDGDVVVKKMKATRLLKWKNKKCIALNGYYHQEAVLYVVDSARHKNREMRDEAWSRIGFQMDISGNSSLFFPDI